MSHTPGPWRNDNGAITAAGGATVAEVYLVGDNPALQREDYEPTRAECEANARLLAAAPDLLALARAYEQWEADLVLSREAWQGGMAELPTLTYPLYDRLLEIQALRNAALAKVKGA